MRKGVMRPGHVQIRVLDIGEAVAHYRDVLGLIETGARINNACEGCHADFWYRRDI